MNRPSLASPARSPLGAGQLRSASGPRAQPRPLLYQCASRTRPRAAPAGGEAADSALRSILQRLDSLDRGMSQLGRGMSQTQARLGYLVEESLRGKAAAVVGPAYVEPLAARSLVDLARMWPPGYAAEAAPGRARPPPGDPLLRTAHLAASFGSALADAGVPLRLLLGLRPQAVRDDASAPAWVDERGQLCVAAVGDAIGRMQDKALQQLLSKVLRAARLSGEEQVEELLSPSGAGIACAVAAAFPGAYLADAAGGGGSVAGNGAGSVTAPALPQLPRFPPEELEFDFRGSVEIKPDGACCDIGEAKSRIDYSSAVQQLGLRLGVLRWLLVACCGVPDRGVDAVGRLFVPASGEGRPAPLDKSQEEAARSMWRFRLRLDPV